MFSLNPIDELLSNIESAFMRNLFKLLSVILLFSCNKNEEPQEPVKQEPLVSAFFGMDNVLPGLLCNQPGSLLDGMPVNFRFPLDSSSLSETDFEVVDSLGNIHIPMNAVLSPANENGENRTVLLLGEFGTAVTNPPVEVRVVGDLFTIDTLPEAGNEKKALRKERAAKRKTAKAQKKYSQSANAIDPISNRLG